MTNDEMTNDLTTNDRELDLWREQWSNVAPLSPEFQRQVQKRIKVQHRRFWLSNLLAVAGVVLMLISLSTSSAIRRAGSKKTGQPACAFWCSWLLHVVYGLCGEHGVRKHSRFALSWNSGGTEECCLKSGDSRSAST
jgi:hypothetical protein